MRQGDVLHLLHMSKNDLGYLVGQAMFIIGVLYLVAFVLIFMSPAGDICFR